MIKEHTVMLVMMSSIFGVDQNVMKMIGAVSFIRLLLVLAGVEMNPGPVKQQFVFRYQYLLIDVGTEVVQKLFDSVIGTSLSSYLAANVKAGQKLTFLMTSGKITKSQQAVLPPIDKNPVSSNFDITLLSCLLRNVCGLRHFNDAVWTSPAPTDHSLEADLTRLRECRNQVAHMHTVYMSDADLTIKWIELTEILKRLNSCHRNGVTDLSSKVNEAEHMDIDEKLRNHYDTTVDQWREMERLYDHGIEDLKVKMDDIEQGLCRLKLSTDNLQKGQTDLKQEFSTLKKDQTDIKDTQAEIKDAQSEIKDAQSEIKHERSKIKDAQSKIKDTQSEIKDAQSEIKDVQSEIKHERSKIKDAQSEIKNAQSEIKKAESEIKDTQSEIKGIQSEIKHERSKIKDTQSEIIDTQSEIKDAQSEIRHERSNIKDTQSEIKHAQSEIKDTQSNIKEAESEIKDTHSEIKDAQSVLKHDLEQLKQEQTQLKEDVQKDKLATYQKEQDLENEKDLKRRLMTIYQKDCSTLPVLPLCDKDEDDVSLLSIYKPASLFHVPYHRSEDTDHEKTYRILGFEYIFSEEDRCFNNVFITGDAGVGKSSFCKYVSLLWYIYKSQCKEQTNDHITQETIHFIANFEFVFLISLQDTDRTDVISMILEQVYTEAECDGKMNELYKLVENILRNRECLVILDGLDEWNPKTGRKKDYVLPDKVTAEKCKYLVTCRPYKIETVRLSRKDIERQVQMTGIEEESVEIYVEEIVNRCNKANGEKRNPNAFIREVNDCGLYNQLCIPIIGSHLVAIWFDFELTDMSRALIYSHIIEMLFERAERRSIRLTPAEACNIQIPDNLAGLCYIKHNFGFLAKLCLLSFRSLFQLDKCVSVLVYTRKQLLSDPYFFSIEEMDFLCKLGILSRNKVIGRLGKQEQKLSYLHKSYLEYFAALFVVSFDDAKAFASVLKEWNTISDVLQFNNFLIFLSGFSYEIVSQLLEKIYSCISDDLTSCMRNTIFSYDHRDKTACRAQVMSLQSTVIHCFNQIGRLDVPKIKFRLTDFIFGQVADSLPYYYVNIRSNDDVIDANSLKQLLWLNRACVHSLYSVYGEYYQEFDHIQDLQILHIGAPPKLKTAHGRYDERFNKCMRNQSLLHTVCVKGNNTVVHALPVRSLHNLTSLSLSRLQMPHNEFHDLVKFLSENVLMQNIRLTGVTCVNHQYRYRDCTPTVDLSSHTHLTSLYLWYVNIICTNVNTTCLKYVTLHPFSEEIACSYINVLNCIKDTKLTHFAINGGHWLDDTAIKHLTTEVTALPYITYLRLSHMSLNDLSIQLNPEVAHIKIVLWEVTMTFECFYSFIDKCVNNRSGMTVTLFGCKFLSRGNEIDWKMSLKYMLNCLEAIPTVNVSYKPNGWLKFETSGWN